MDKVTVRQMKAIAKKLEKMRLRAAKVRDDLRDLQGEIEELADDFDPEYNGLGDACQELDRAIDAMSGLV